MPPARRAPGTRAPSRHAGTGRPRRRPPRRTTPRATRATRSRLTADSRRHPSARPHRTRKSRGAHLCRASSTHGAIASTTRVRDAGPCGHRADHPGHRAGHRAGRPDRRAGPRAVREPCRVGVVDLFYFQAGPSSCSFRCVVAVGFDRRDQLLGRNPAAGDQLTARPAYRRAERRRPRVLPHEHGRRTAGRQ